MTAMILFVLLCATGATALTLGILPRASVKGPSCVAPRMRLHTRVCSLASVCRCRVAARLSGDEILIANIEAVIASDEIQAALQEEDDGEWEMDEEEWEMENGETEEISLAPAHARKIDVLDETVFVAKAWREEDFLSQDEQPLRPLKSATAATVAKALTENGVGRVPGVLSAATVESLRAFVLAQLIEAEKAAEEDDDDDEFNHAAFRLVVVGSGTQRLSDERGRVALSTALGTETGASAMANAAGSEREEAFEGSNRRWDLRLPTDAPVVRTALSELLAPEAALGGALDTLAGGSEAQLWELAAIVSAPGAAPQVVHADTVWQPTPLLFTAFIALQDISREMGPTRFIPRTHGIEAPHEALAKHGDATGLAASPGAPPPPSRVGTLTAGEAAVYDGRLLHCGGANRSDRLRMLFYVTVRAASAAGCDVSGDGPEAASTQGSATLGELREELFPREP